MSALPSAAACPGAALVKCTWYTSVAAEGFVCAYDGVAATTPPNTANQRIMDLISLLRSTDPTIKRGAVVALMACSDRRERVHPITDELVPLWRKGHCAATTWSLPGVPRRYKTEFSMVAGLAASEPPLLAEWRSLAPTQLQHAAQPAGVWGTASSAVVGAIDDGTQW